MDIRSRVTDAFGKVTAEFAGAAPLQKLLQGKASPEELKSFIANVFRTHYLSAHIVAFCFASLPSKASALLRENMLEEMGQTEDQAHSALLLKLAQGAGFNDADIERLKDDARGLVRAFCAMTTPFATLRDLCLAVLLETMSFEFMLSRCSRPIADALASRYAISKTALEWFELHSEVDIRHAQEGLTVIEDYVSFHQVSEDGFERVLHATFARNIFVQKYFSGG